MKHEAIVNAKFFLVKDIHTPYRETEQQETAKGGMTGLQSGNIVQQANSENCGPPLGNNFYLEKGQRSRPRCGVT